MCLITLTVGNSTISKDCNITDSIITGLLGLVLKNIGEKIGKFFQKCKRNIGKYIQKIGKI